MFSVLFLVSFVAAGFCFLSRPQRINSLQKGLPRWARSRGTADPFYPFRRWDWTALPPHWKSALGTSILGIFMFATLAAWFGFRTERPTGLTLFALCMTLFHCVHLVRILRKVSSLTRG